jgi:hypothetical protein
VNIAARFYGREFLLSTARFGGAVTRPAAQSAVRGASIAASPDYMRAMFAPDVAPPAVPLIHSLKVRVDGRRYRVILQNGEPIAVAVWVAEEFGPCNPHAYWRRLWAKGERAPGRVVRVAIAKAMTAPVVTLAVD